MLIRKRRIRSLSRYFSDIPRGSDVIIALRTPTKFGDRMTEIGFPDELAVGQKILPSSLGPVSSYNADGKELVHKDQPMETVYRQAEWKWKEFRGRYDYEEMSKIVEIPYERYPRTFLPPPSIELEVVEGEDGEIFIVSPTTNYNPDNEELLLHIVNLFLELFGECETLRTDLTGFVRAPVVRLNWEILPQGRHPWPRLRRELRRVLDRQAGGVRAVIDKRFEAINAHSPEFVAVGRGGFDGYVIFGFPNDDLYVLESTQINNATYVLDRNWEEISTLTKAEILDGNLHRQRVIHRESWFNEIENLLPDGT